MVRFLLRVGLRVCNTAQRPGFSLKETAKEQMINQEIKG